MTSLDQARCGLECSEETEASAVDVEGGGADLLKAGVRAEIDGKLEEAMGIGFGTPVLSVKNYKIL